jgi:hypothetical protein
MSVLSTINRVIFHSDYASRLVAIGLLIGASIIIWLAYVKIDEEIWGPPILRHSLGPNFGPFAGIELVQHDETMNQVIQEQFPRGSSERSLADELMREGFEDQPDRVDEGDIKSIWHVRSYNIDLWGWYCSPHRLLVRWTSDEEKKIGRVVSRIELCVPIVL